MRTTPLILLAAAGLPALAATAGEPTARDLVALAPTISSADAGVRSIEIAGYDQADGRMIRSFRALYKAPDKFLFVLRDGPEGTPIAFAVGKQMFLYDPVKPRVLVFPHASNYRVLQHLPGGEYEDNWGAKLSGREPDRLVLDLKSVFAAEVKDGATFRESVAKEGEGRYVLVRQEGNACKRLHVDLNRPTPAFTYETAASPDGPANHGVDRIVVNGELGDSEFTFPSMTPLAGFVDVEEVGEGLLASTDALNVLARTLYVRQALHEPKASRGVITPLLAGVRFGRVEENDAVCAGPIRRLVPPDPIRREAAPPGKVDDAQAVKRAGFEGLRDRLPKFPYKLKFGVDFK